MRDGATRRSTFARLRGDSFDRVAGLSMMGLLATVELLLLAEGFGRDYLAWLIFGPSAYGGWVVLMP